MRTHIGKHRTKILLVALCTAAASAGAFFHAHVGQAWGWWEPLDPPNYYSPTSISWADTEDPDHFFYRDLEQQGGTVYDYTRIIKSVLFGEKFAHILASLRAQLGLDLINHRPLDSGVLHMSTKTVQHSQYQTAMLYTLMQQDALTESTAFHTYDERHEDYDAPRSRPRQRQEISAAAAKYARIAALTCADGDAVRGTVHRLMEVAAHAQGETELHTIKEQLRAVSVSNDAQITALLAAKVQLENDLRRVQLDKEIEWEKQAQEAKIIVTDPYDEKAAAPVGYVRAQPHGFVRFQ